MSVSLICRTCGGLRMLQSKDRKSIYICPDCQTEEDFLAEQVRTNGQLLKEFRLHILNMGLRVFAEWLGVRPSCIANVEQGRRFDDTPSADDYSAHGSKACETCGGKGIVEKSTTERANLCQRKKQ